MARVRSTDDVPARDRLEYWRSVICDGLAPHEVTVSGHLPVFGRMAAANVGLLLVRDGQGSAVCLNRTPALIRRSDPELAYLLVQVAGRSAVSLRDGTQVLLAPGDLVLGDTSRPTRWDALVPCHMHRVVMPRSLLPLGQGDLARAAGVPIPGRSGPAAVLAALVRELVAHSDDADLRANVSLSVAVVDMLAAVMADRLDRSHALPPETRRSALLLRVKAYIELNLSDPALSPSAVAAAHHVSLRHLQNLFAAEQDTASSWIRRRRLERCRGDLLDPSMAHQPAALIGARWGYVNAVTFSRAFCAHFGMPPKAYRTAHLPRRGPMAPPDVRLG